MNQEAARSGNLVGPWEGLLAADRKDQSLVTSSIVGVAVSRDDLGELIK